MGSFHQNWMHRGGFKGRAHHTILCQLYKAHWGMHMQNTCGFHVRHVDVVQRFAVHCCERFWCNGHVTICTVTALHLDILLFLLSDSHKAVTAYAARHPDVSLKSVFSSCRMFQQCGTALDDGVSRMHWGLIIETLDDHWWLSWLAARFWCTTRLV